MFVCTSSIVKTLHLVSVNTSAENNWKMKNSFTVLSKFFLKKVLQVLLILVGILSTASYARKGAIWARFSFCSRPFKTYSPSSGGALTLWNCSLGDLRRCCSSGSLQNGHSLSWCIQEHFCLFRENENGRRPPRNHSLVQNNAQKSLESRCHSYFGIPHDVAFTALGGVRGELAKCCFSLAFQYWEKLEFLYHAAVKISGALSKPQTQKQTNNLFSLLWSKT